MSSLQGVNEEAYFCLWQHGANLVDGAEVSTVPPDVSKREAASDGHKSQQ